MIYPSNVAATVSILRPDLAMSDAVAAVLVADPDLSADDVIALLDEATAEYALDLEYERMLEARERAVEESVYCLDSVS